jgi:hypothetical protein
MAWCSISDVRRELNLQDQSLTDAEITDWISTAYHKISAELGRFYMQDQFVIQRKYDGTTDNVVKTYFRPLLSVDSVYKNTGEPISSGSYTVDINLATVTFNSGIVEPGNVIIVENTPAILKTYEAKLTALLIMTRTLITSPSEEQDAMIERLEEEAKGFKDVILSKPNMGVYKEHNITTNGRYGGGW